jgi:hypothetical protein
MCKSFPLKRNFPVGLVMIAAAQQMDQVFGQVPDIEENKACFELLAQMNTLVVEQNLAGKSGLCQYKRKKGYAFHPQKRDFNYNAFEIHA